MARRRKNATFTLDQTYGAGRADRSFITSFYAALDKAYPGSKQIPIPPLKNIHPTRPPIEQAIIFADCVRSVLAPLVAVGLGHAELAQELEDLPMLDADEVMAKCRLSGGQSDALRKETTLQVEAIFNKYDPLLRAQRARSATLLRAQRARSATPAFSQQMLDEVNSDHARARAEFDDTVALLRSAEVGYYEPDRVRKINLLTAQAEVLYKKLEQLHTKREELKALALAHHHGSVDPLAPEFNAYSHLHTTVHMTLRVLFRLIGNVISNEDPKAHSGSFAMPVDFHELSVSMVEGVRLAAKANAEATWDVVNQTLEQL